MGKKGKKYSAHQNAIEKKILDDQKSPPPTSRVKWSAPKVSLNPVAIWPVTGQGFQNTK